MLQAHEIPTAILVDNRNWHLIKDDLLEEMRKSPLTGLDIETEDSRRHDGLNKLMKVDSDGAKGKKSKLLFDTNRTTVTGFSVYADGADHAFYVNIGHADVENRIPWEEAKQVLEAIPDTACHVAHNAPYERTMLRKSLGHNLGANVICTMQLAVTAFNGDTYSVDDFLKPGLGGISKLVPAINREYYSYNPGDALTNEQEELLFKVIAKESKSDHSYNGFVKSIAYGFGLKGLTQKFLGYQQTTFDEVLNGKAHMGQLTGEEVCAYGADDAWTAVKLYHKLLDYLLKNNPAVVPIFFEQENPMTEVYSEVWGDGVNIDLDAVKAARDRERKKVAENLRTMKASVKAMLPFPDDGGHEKLVKYDEKKYNVAKYRGDVTRWAEMPDSEVDFTQCYQVKSAISKPWAAEQGKPESKGISINYYQVVRCILYDLLRCSFQLSDGKIQSDKEAQAKMRERFIKKMVEAKFVSFDSKDKDKKFPIRGLCKDEEWDRVKHTITILDSFRALADADTTMKLFINKYLWLTDPETGKVYPVLNSLLASRRMALAEPNLSQLGKFSAGAYVRSFFKADKDDHVVLTMDWSSVELVLIGDASGDPEFAIVFGKRPFGDLHSETAAAILGMEVHVFKREPNAKQLRTDIGKPANFGYWYSGGLGTVANELGWSSEQMWEYVEKYRAKYHVGEAWRQSVIQETKETGIVTLPDHHQRIRFESTYSWAGYMRQKADPYGEPFRKFMDICIKKIQTRSGNQAVNSRIQGSCATLAKRSILKMRKVTKEEEFEARFMFPVHDELVFSVHRSQVWRFKKALWKAMCEGHEDIVTNLLLDASCAVGLNYQAWHPVNNPKGQIELDELTKLPFMPKERWGQVATQEECELIVEYLFSEEGDERFKPLDEEAIKIAAAELAAKEAAEMREEVDV